jgi:DNA-binding transcriptional MerR regulator
VAKEADVPRSTVQFYHQIGILQSCGRTKGGYLLFNNVAVDKMKLIKKLRTEKRSVEEIKNFFKKNGLLGA